MGLRRQAREAALQALFMCDFLGRWNSEEVVFCFDHFAMPKAARTYACELCDGVLDNRNHIDSQLTCASENWSISRMGRVDRAILRLAAYEILFVRDIPTSVAINEAIEIAKRFGSDESPTFVNGVLDKVASSLKASTGLKSKLEIEVVSKEDSTLVSEDVVSSDKDGVVN